MGKLFLESLRNFSVYASTTSTNFLDYIKKRLIIIMIGVLLFYAFQVDAQDTLKIIPVKWQTELNSNLNLSQLALANWTGGGQSALSLNTRHTAHLGHTQGRLIWNNTLDVAYGLQKINGGGLRKSDDLLKLVSVLNYTFANPRWQWTTQLNFWSQFAPGFNYAEDPGLPDIEISRFMAPGYFQQALGLSYAVEDQFQLSILPVTGKVTVVVEQALAPRYGLGENERVKTELGASFNLNVNKTIWENILLLADLNLFSGYQPLTRIDVNGELQLKMKVNKYISTSLAAQLIYDHDVDIDRELEGVQRDVQFKELLTIGFVYNWGGVD